MNRHETPANAPPRRSTTIYARLFGHKTRWQSDLIGPIATTPVWGTHRTPSQPAPTASGTRQQDPDRIRISRQTRAAGQGKMQFRPRWTAEPLLRGHRPRLQRKSCVIHRLASCQQANVCTLPATCEFSIHCAFCYLRRPSTTRLSFLLPPATRPDPQIPDKSSPRSSPLQPISIGATARLNIYTIQDH